MNDKNFIEELRQKRDEYGVTQTRLAVACGISRTYFNQIENGTVVPSAELKQTIEKQIERFNPQEPLFLLIDYFRVRFPTTDAVKIIREILQLKADYMLYEDFGKYGYEIKERQATVLILLQYGYWGHKLNQKRADNSSISNCILSALRLCVWLF